MFHWWTITFTFTMTPNTSAKAGWPLQFRFSRVDITIPAWLSF